ncbi:MAG TPA: hypothetical protein VFX03_10285, partial [Thermomicrobiales bacterium]|nr:hypothetical protein [Thermomicrobiales bacterium]
MRPTVNKQALSMAPRRMPGRRLRGATPPSAPASRGATFGMVEDIRLRQLPTIAIMSLALVAVLELVQAGVLLAMGQPVGVPELSRDLILKTPW